jgi:hypothetical protein
MRDYDSWKLDTPDNHVVELSECEHCGSMVYKGEDFFDFSEGLFHVECWWEREDREIEEEEYDQ